MLTLVVFIIFGQGNIKHYKDKIYYIEPEKAEKIAKDNVLLFNTHIIAQKAYLLKNGGVITYDNQTIKAYSADGALSDTYKLNFQPSIIVPSPDGDFCIIGKIDRNKKTYELFKLNMKHGDLQHILTIDTKHFPGIPTATERAKNTMKDDPSFANDFYWLMVASINFQGGKIVGDNLYLWYPPKVGMSFGGVYRISLKTKKLDILIKDLGFFCGMGKKSISYIPLSDKDAAEMAHALYLKKQGKLHKSPFTYISSNTLFANGIGATIKDSVFYVFRFSMTRPMYKQIIKGKDARLLLISPSGKRIFLTYRSNGKHILSLFDVREGKLENLFETTNGQFDNLWCSFDGEGFIFTHKDTLYRGYLNDLYAPYVISSMPDTTYKDTIKVKILSYDDAFVSQGTSLFYNEKAISPDTVLVLPLSEGDNFFTFKAMDRAGNVRRVKKHVFYIPKKE